MNKARLDSSELVRFNPPVIPPPAQFADNPQVILLDSDSEDNESEISAETSPSLNTPTNLNQTSVAKAGKIACLEARMEKVLAKPNPWKCSICSDKFATSQNLQNHVKVHHKGYNYFCKQCPYFSKYYPDKCKHERAHQENERKYKIGGRQCKLCNTWYSQGHFNRHLRLYHGD